MVDFRKKLAEIKALKEAEAKHEAVPAIEAPKQEGQKEEERRIEERRHEDRRKESLTKPIEEIEHTEKKSFQDWADAQKDFEQIAAQIKSLQEKKDKTKLSLLEQIKLKNLLKEWEVKSASIRDSEEQNAQTEEEQKAGDDPVQEQQNEAGVSSEASDSKEQDASSEGDSSPNSSGVPEAARKVELGLDYGHDTGLNDAEYQSLLFKEEAGSLSLMERIKLNKLKVKYAPPPIEIPTDYGVSDEALEQQDEKLTEVEGLKEKVASESPIGFLAESAMSKALKELEDQKKEQTEKEKEDNARKIAEAIAIAKATQGLQEERKKMSFKEMLAAKKKAQEEAALAMDDSDSIETLTSSLEADDHPLAAAVTYEKTVPQEQQEKEEADNERKTETFSLDITLNAEQLMAKELAFAGKSFCLIGAAGTGKTSTQRDVAKTLLKSGMLKETDFKSKAGGKERVTAPSIAFCAYTRRASGNLARAIHKDPELCEALSNNIMTIHHLLEYEPVNFYDAEKEKDSMRFEPQKTATNPLSITHLVIEEASMLGLDLWEKLYEALPFGVQIIFIGDINQLPPVFGSSILNYALVQLPVVELKTVYRQASDSLVLANAHNILKGKTLEEGKGFTIVRGKSPVQVGQAKTSQTLSVMFKKLYEAKEYDPEDCIILTPFNKQDLGTDMMNKHIAQFLGEKRGAVVHEIIAGMNKHYLAVGDKVMYNKQDGVITAISKNGLYHGREPQIAGTDLTRFGVRILGANGGLDLDDDSTLIDYSNFSVDELADQAAERKQQASHIVTIEMETGLTQTLESVGDFGQQTFTLAYALTVHKAQGCEWRKVFGILHKDHAVMLQRELFYTMVTRAREEFVLIAKDTVIEKAIRNQKIKGNSLADKIEYFNSGALDVGVVSCTK
jgi:ATP-dependent exoDNAse (exonuclease V) alpha subunit